jgi:hypothetical protein
MAVCLLQGLDLGLQRVCDRRPAVAVRSVAALERQRPAFSHTPRLQTRSLTALPALLTHPGWDN